MNNTHITSGTTPKQTIRSKLIRIVLLGIASTTLLTLLLSSWMEIQSFNKNKTMEVRATALIFASMAADPLVRKDRQGALKAIGAISKIPSFKSAHVLDMFNRPLAKLGSPALINGQKDLPVIFRKVLEVSVPIISGGSEVGKLSVAVDTSDMFKRLKENLLVCLAAAMIASFAGILIVCQFQKKITKPIGQLTKSMLEIQKKQDFSGFVKNYSDDEAGLLVNAFNSMLSTLRDRDEGLAAHRTKLEDEILNRTYEFNQAKELAEHAKAAQSSFLATMSHEIRTPMNGILVMAELLARTNLPPQHQRYADVIHRSGESLLAIINDILDFSKIESGKLELEATELNVPETINNAISLFWERAQEKNLDIASYIAPDVPEVIEGDPVRLNQIVSNLINNALKFTESGYISVGVQIASKDPDGHLTLEFSIRDTGIGIAPDKLDTIFSAFSQADQSITRRFGGTGLGLAICKRLAGAMGGGIAVSSSPGEGSVFSFTVLTRDLTEKGLSGALTVAPHLTKAIIGAARAATGASLIKYLQDMGLEAGYPEPDLPFITACADAGVVFMQADDIERLGPELYCDDASQNPYIIGLEKLGETRIANLLDDGLAHDMLMCPFSRTDIYALMDRLSDGAPLGRAVPGSQDKKQKNLPWFNDMLVLIADDSAVNREVTKEALGRLNIKTVTADDGLTALEACKTNNFDAIFMDCSMPKMSGFDATRDIREMERRNSGPRVPVIALTAHIASSNTDEWKRSGMDHYITKPFTISELAECLSRLCPDKLGAPEDAPSNIDFINAVPEQQAVSHESGGSVINLSVLDQIAGFRKDENVEAMLRILDLFTEHASETFSHLEKSLEEAKPEDIAKTAHAIKSMSGNIGAERLFQACARLESGVRQEVSMNVQDQVDNIGSELEQVLERIKELSQTMRSQGQSAAMAVV